MALCIFDFSVIQEADGRTSPDDISSIMLFFHQLSCSLLLFPTMPPQLAPTSSERKGKLTSFLQTGFSMHTRWVKFLNPPSGSRSANSLKLFAVNTSVVRFGIDFASVGWMEDKRLRASSRVLKRGESGMFERIWMSLSVRSMASCGYCYIRTHSNWLCLQSEEVKKTVRRWGKYTYTSNAQILNRGYLMSCKEAGFVSSTQLNLT